MVGENNECISIPCSTPGDAQGILECSPRTAHPHVPAHRQQDRNAGDGQMRCRFKGSRRAIGNRRHVRSSDAGLTSSPSTSQH